MFEKLMAWFKPTKAEQKEAQRLAQYARDLEHGHTHEHVDGIVHTHDHRHGDHEHDHDHGKE
jgi:hypothetical protein